MNADMSHEDGEAAHVSLSGSQLVLKPTPIPTSARWGAALWISIGIVCSGIGLLVLWIVERTQWIAVLGGSSDSLISLARWGLCFVVVGIVAFSVGLGRLVFYIDERRRERYGL